MKEKYLWAGIIIAIISWFGNYMYFQSQQLDEPIFLDHYYETYIEERTHLTFYYLTNKQYTANISYVDINGIEGYPVSNSGFSMWNMNDTPQYEQEFRHQYLKSVTIELPPSSLQLKKGSDDIWSFKKMIVTFTNGQKVTADIGQVNIVPPISEQVELLSRMTGSSNQHREVEILVATKDITIENITIPFLKNLTDDVALKIDLDQEKLKQFDRVMYGEDPPSWFKEGLDTEWEELSGVSIQDFMLPFTLKTGEWMRLSMQFNPERSSYFQYAIKIKGRTNSGKTFAYNIPINDSPSLNQKNINAIIAAKQEGHPNE